MEHPAIDKDMLSRNFAAPAPFRSPLPEPEPSRPRLQEAPRVLSPGTEPALLSWLSWGFLPLLDAARRVAKV